MDSVKTGVGGLDDLFQRGGYPRSNQILVLGGPGSGKSIFAAQYLYYGAKEYGEHGIYVSLEEEPEKIMRNMSAFNWDFKSLESAGKIKFLDTVGIRIKDGDEAKQKRVKETLDVDNMAVYLENMIDWTSAKRVVIDSLSMMGMYTRDEFALRSKLLKLSKMLTRKGVTSLLLNEAKSKNVGVQEFTTEMFMFDGVITLEFDRYASERKLSIAKMRGTKHAIGTFMFDIGDSGIALSF